MKFLFERLDSQQETPIRTRIAESLDQIAGVQYLSDAQAPPGIFNFGLPRAVDVSLGQAAGEAYAALLARRIREFEPRLTRISARFEGGQVRIQALCLEDQESFAWTPGERYDRE